MLKRVVAPKALPPVAVLAERSDITPGNPECNIAAIPLSPDARSWEKSVFRFRFLRRRSTTVMRRTMLATPPTTPPTTLFVESGGDPGVSAGLSPTNVWVPLRPVAVESPFPSPPPPPPPPLPPKSLAKVGIRADFELIIALDDVIVVLLGIDDDEGDNDVDDVEAKKIDDKGKDDKCVEKGLEVVIGNMCGVVSAGKRSTGMTGGVETEEAE